MTVIGIIGAPGVGKSFLVKQLACASCSPAFFEGENGIFPEKILKVLNSEKDSRERYDWLFGRYKTTLERAQKISKAGVDCYVDGDVMTVEAWLDAEIGDKSPSVLREWLRKNSNLRADVTVVLYADEQKILDTINSRARASEQNDFIKERALRIQRACIKLGKKNKRAILIDRTNLDFTDDKTLKKLQRRIKNLLKNRTNIKK